MCIYFCFLSYGESVPTKNQILFLLAPHYYRSAIQFSLEYGNICDKLNPYSQELRTRNLKRIFGNAIQGIDYLDTSADKDEILENYSHIYPEHYWIEDKVKNAFVGAKFGFDSMLLKHPYTKLEDTTGITVCSDWKQIYERIIGE